MKKLVSIILIAVLIISATSVSAFAFDPLPNAPTLQERFEENYGKTKFFEEEYSHYSEEIPNFVDWVLIIAATEIILEPIENPTPHSFIIGDIVYSSIYYYMPFPTPYCIYDAWKNEFISITQVDFDEYDGLREVLCTGKYGRIIGNVNGDSSLTVMDATEIQRVIAQLSTFSENCKVSGSDAINHIADFNRDKQVNVMDATAIQMKLAKLK